MLNNNEEKTSLKMLKLLIDEVQNKTDLLEKLNIKEPTFYKYYNLMKKAGFKIDRNKNNYEIINFKHAIEFERYEFGILAYIFLVSNNMLPERKIKIFDKIFSKIVTLSNQKSYKAIIDRYEFYRLTLMSEEYKEKITTFDEYIKNQQKVKILTKNKKELEILPVKFDWSKNKIKLNYLNNDNKMCVISIDNIIKIVDIKDSIFNDAKETIFELYGKLVKSYVLKNDERIIDKNNDKLVVANYGTDKKTLFRRLLRYDSLCKIVSLSSDVDEFKNMIKLTLENLGGKEDNNK